MDPNVDPETLGVAIDKRPESLRVDLEYAGGLYLGPP